MQQSFDTAGIDISGMIDRSIGFGDKARRIGQETLITVLGTAFFALGVVVI